MYCIFPHTVLHSFSARMLLVIWGKTLFSGQLFWRHYISLSLKHGHKRNMRGRLSSIKRCMYFFPHICFARIVLLVQGTILSSRQIGTCKPLRTIFPFKECCNEHQPLHIFTAILNVKHTLDIEEESGVLKEILYDWTKAE